MKLRTLTAFLLVPLALMACGKPVPDEKMAYVGEWQSRTMYLLISQEGSVIYKFQEAGLSKSIEAPLQGFKGNNFEVGLGPLSTEFKVDTPPHPVGDSWKMVVDGVELTRTDATPDHKLPGTP